MRQACRKNYRSGRLLTQLFSVLVWLAAVGGVIVLFYNRSQNFEVVGLASGKVCLITSASDGRLKDVKVQLFDVTKRDQVIAVLEDDEFRTQAAVCTAEIDNLTAQLATMEQSLRAQATDRQIEQIRTYRSFCVDVETAQKQVLELKTTLETDRATLESLKKEFEISKELVKQDAIAPNEMEKAKYLYDSMANKVKETEQWLIRAQADLKESQQRRDEFASQTPYSPSIDSALAVINKQIKVQERMIEHYMSQCQAMVLKSPVDGVVSQIQKGAGETVIAGEPILTVVEQNATDIVAYVNQNQSLIVKERMPVQIVKNGKPVQISDTQVTRLGPGVELIPQQLWQNPRAEEWGRAVYIKIPPNLKLVPGETVGIRGL